MVSMGRIDTLIERSPEPDHPTPDGGVKSSLITELPKAGPRSASSAAVG